MSLACRLSASIAAAQNQAEAQARSDRLESRQAVTAVARSSEAEADNIGRLPPAAPAQRMNGLVVDAGKGPPHAMESAKFASRVYSEMQKLIQPAA